MWAVIGAVLAGLVGIFYAFYALAALGRALGLTTPWRSNREVWLALSPKLAGAIAADFRWDSLPSAGRRRGFVPLAAGTVDGRLPGQRDRMAPEGAEPPERGVAPSGW
jgi:NADH-quinone oxidoreductase subunit G